MTDPKTSPRTARIAGRDMPIKAKPASPYYCSFCGKADHEVKHIVEGPTVFICDECVSLCVAICCKAIPDYLPSIMTDVEAPHAD